MALKIGTNNIRYVVKGDIPLQKIATWQNEYILTNNIQATVYDPAFGENYTNVNINYSNITNINTTTRTFTCNLFLSIIVYYEREQFPLLFLVGNFNNVDLWAADYASSAYSEVNISYGTVNITFSQNEWNNIYIYMLEKIYK